MNKSRILFVDDDPLMLGALRRMLVPMFREWELSFATRPAEALEMITRAPFDVIVSDQRMPGTDGASLLASARARAPHSVRVMLTGATDQQTAVEAVNQGGVFRFLTKPCSFETLRATLVAAIEEHQSNTAGADSHRDELVGPGGIVLYPRAHEVHVGDGVVNLTAREFPLLRLLLERRGEVLTADTIATQVWGDAISSRALVEVNVSRLRAKLRRAGAGTAIATVRGTGYIIR